MKKSAFLKVIPLFLVLLFAIALISGTAQSQAPVSPYEGVQNPNEAIAQQLGMNPENFDIGELRQKYLAQEWGKIVANTSIIGPVHKFFLSQPVAFTIIFGMPYEFSLTFFLIVILWFFVMFNVKKIVNAIQFIKSKLFSWIMGILVAIILTQGGLFKGIVNFTLNIIFRQENWWIRGLIWLVALAILILAQYFSVAMSKYIATQKKAKAEAEAGQAKKVVQTIAKGATKGK